jgi:hypothetical protein
MLVGRWMAKVILLNSQMDMKNKTLETGELNLKKLA